MSDKESCIQQIEKIVKEIENLPDDPLLIDDIAWKERHFLPVLLNVGNGEQMHITPQIDRMLASFSKTVMEVFFQSRKSDFTNPDWNRMVKRAFGESLVSQVDDTSIETNAEIILELVKEKLNDWINGIQEREYIFGCHLCNIPDFEPLLMGSVKFEPRLVWLERVFGNGNVSKVSRSRTQRSWQGERLRKRQNSSDRINETQTLKTIGESDFVCSVNVAKTGEEAGVQKALTAARLAMTVIALAWERPSSALSHMTLIYDRNPYQQHYLVAIPDRPFGWGSSRSYIPGGVTWLREEQWAELRTDHDDIFACAGEIMKYVTHGKDCVSRPKILNALFQAILWLHEGCREQVDFIAIVKFCSSLDALANGERLKGIQDLIKVRLDLKDEVKHLKKIEKIYGDGRSRTIHGTSDKLGHDGSSTRYYVESLARLCLLRCLQWTVKYGGTDDPKCFRD